MRAHAVGAAAAATAALLSLPTAAYAAPGDSGDVKIHSTTTPVDSQVDEPKVCVFYLDAFNFDTVGLVTWTVNQQPPAGSAQVLAGSLVLVGGLGHTGDLVLPDGTYELTFSFLGQTGGPKHKVFDVDCAGVPAGASASASQVTKTVPAVPVGGVGTGTGGSVHDLNAGEITAGGTLIAGAGGLVLRNRRRARRHDPR
jgi:hypothetical protein